jgi:hypothetical protein
MRTDEYGMFPSRTETWRNTIPDKRTNRENERFWISNCEELL